MLNCFTRVHIYLYHSGFITEVTVILRKKYDAKLPRLYQIRARTDVQYSRRAQRAQVQEINFKSNIIRYSSLLRYNSLQTYPFLMKEFPLPSLSLLKKIIFPAFEYDGFKDTILFKGGQTSWKLYHVVLKKIAHLRLT